MEKIRNAGRIPAMLVALILGVALGAGFLAPVKAQDPAFAQPAQWYNFSATAPAAATVIPASTTGQRYVIKSMVLTDTVSEKVTLIDAAATIYQFNLIANTPLVLGADFFGPTGFVPAAANTAFKVTAPTGVTTLSGRYLLQ